MHSKSANIKNRTIVLLDKLLSPLTYFSAKLLKFIRSKGVDRMTLSRKIFRKVGVFPVEDHYYEPFFNPAPNKGLNKSRALKAINLNIKEQLTLLESFNCETELNSIQWESILSSKQHLEKFPFFQPMEADYYYSMIRTLKPKRIVEIGSGYSTLVALRAISENKSETEGYKCEMICIEPFENKWLEDTGAQIIREKVEDVDLSFFDQMEKNDILFIDSSHVIKPGSDVLHEYFNILPVLKAGVFIHIHDIFTPDHYPDKWLIDKVTFWNEQYLLEAFLMYNDSFRVVGALNFLSKNYPDKIKDKLPSLISYPDQFPASFWIRRS